MSGDYAQEYYQSIVQDDGVRKLLKAGLLVVDDEICALRSASNVWPVLHKISWNIGDETPVKVTFNKGTPKYQFRIDDNFAFEELRLPPVDAASNFIDFVYALYVPQVPCRVTRYKIGNHDVVDVESQKNTYRGIGDMSAKGVLYEILPQLKKKHDSVIFYK